MKRQELVPSAKRIVKELSRWLYHRGAANNSDAKRRVCPMCYQNAWMKSRETFDGPKMTVLRENGTSEQKLMLGGIPRW